MRIFPNKYKQVRYINKIPYLISSIMPIGNIREDLVTPFKEYLGCNVVFKNLKDGVYYFCEEIQEAEFEEIEK